MISTDFAPNERWKDGYRALKIILQPWKWKRGEERDKVKKKLQKWFPKSKVFLYLTGRTALYYLLKGLNLPQNSEILIQAFTCEAVVLPIIALNLKPVYVDIETETFSINPIDLENKISPKAKIIILQHTFGFTPRHRTRILSLVKKHNLLLIEDIAHGIKKNLPLPLSISNYKILSFGRSKSLSSVYGGAIVTNDQKLIKNLSLAQPPFPSNRFILQGLVYKPLTMLVKSTYDLYIGKIFHKLVLKTKILPPEITEKEKKGDYNPAFNKAFPNAFAYLLLQQLKDYNQFSTNRLKISNQYIKLFNKTGFITSRQKINQGLIRFPLLVKNSSFLIDKLKKRNIFLGQWYNQVVAPLGIDLKKLKYKKGTCPQAEKTAETIINLPTNITAEEAAKICQIILRQQ